MPNRKGLLSSTQLMTLNALEQGPGTTEVLATRTHMRRQAMGIALKNMQRNRYVTSMGPTRNLTWTITDKGRQALDTVLQRV